LYLKHRISEATRVILRKAENSEVEVLVPTVVLAELLYVAQRKKISLGIEEVLKRIGKGGDFVIVPFDFPIFEEVMKLPQELELHDRIIVATARTYGAKVLTKDEKITKSGVVQVIW
jgi:predicted nucleic acid-binding protein